MNIHVHFTHSRIWLCNKSNTDKVRLNTVVRARLFWCKPIWRQTFD